jgi:hypothetical protein
VPRLFAKLYETPVENRTCFFIGQMMHALQLGEAETVTEHEATPKEVAKKGYWQTAKTHCLPIIVVCILFYTIYNVF